MIEKTETFNLTEKLSVIKKKIAEEKNLKIDIKKRLEELFLELIKKVHPSHKWWRISTTINDLVISSFTMTCSFSELQHYLDTEDFELISEFSDMIPRHSIISNFKFAEGDESWVSFTFYRMSEVFEFLEKNVIDNLSEEQKRYTLMYDSHLKELVEYFDTYKKLINWTE